MWSSTSTPTEKLPWHIMSHSLSLSITTGGRFRMRILISSYLFKIFFTFILLEKLNREEREEDIYIYIKDKTDRVIEKNHPMVIPTTKF